MRSGRKKTACPVAVGFFYIDRPSFRLAASCCLADWHRGYMRDLTPSRAPPPPTQVSSLAEAFESYVRPLPRAVMAILKGAVASGSGSVRQSISRARKKPLSAHSGRRSMCRPSTWMRLSKTSKIKKAGPVGIGDGDKAPEAKSGLAAAQSAHGQQTQGAQRQGAWHRYRVAS